MSQEQYGDDYNYERDDYQQDPYLDENNDNNQGNDHDQDQIKDDNNDDQIDGIDDDNNNNNRLNTDRHNGVLPDPGDDDDDDELFSEPYLLYVQNIPPSAHESDLRQVFEAFGPVSRIEFLPHAQPLGHHNRMRVANLYFADVNGLKSTLKFNKAHRFDEDKCLSVHQNRLLIERGRLTGEAIRANRLYVGGLPSSLISDLASVPIRLNQHIMSLYALSHSGEPAPFTIEDIIPKGKCAFISVKPTHYSSDVVTLLHESQFEGTKLTCEPSTCKRSPNRTIYVYNLRVAENKDQMDVNLRTFFAPYGFVEHISYPPINGAKQITNVFVRFTRLPDAEEALAKLNGTIIPLDSPLSTGKPLTVEYAKENPRDALRSRQNLPPGSFPPRRNGPGGPLSSSSSRPPIGAPRGGLPRDPSTRPPRTDWNNPRPPRDGPGAPRGDFRDSRDSRGPREPREPREPYQNRYTHPQSTMAPTHRDDIGQGRPPREPREIRDHHEPHQPREPREPRGDLREPREPREPRQGGYHQYHSAPAPSAAVPPAAQDDYYTQPTAAPSNRYNDSSSSSYPRSHHSSTRGRGGSAPRGGYQGYSRDERQNGGEYESNRPVGGAAATPSGAPTGAVSSRQPRHITFPSGEERFTGPNAPAAVNHGNDHGRDRDRHYHDVSPQQQYAGYRGEYQAPQHHHHQQQQQQQQQQPPQQRHHGHHHGNGDHHHHNQRQEHAQHYDEYQPRERAVPHGQPGGYRGARHGGHFAAAPHPAHVTQQHHQAEDESF